MREDELWEVFQKTGGYCPYCGDRLRFENRGWSALPACTECNRLRWTRTGPAPRRLVRLRLLATEEIDRGSPVELHLKAMLKKRLLENEARRLEKYLDGGRWELYRNEHFKDPAHRLVVRNPTPRGGTTTRVTSPSRDRRMGDTGCR
jgi:hypothetical protein